MHGHQLGAMSLLRGLQADEVSGALRALATEPEHGAATGLQPDRSAHDDGPETAALTATPPRPPRSVRPADTLALSAREVRALGASGLLILVLPRSCTRFWSACSRA